MIKLFQFPAGRDIANFSPPCMKVETYMRMAGIPFEIVSVRNPAKAPKGKLPYITDGKQTVADSHFIIHYLKDKFGDILDDHLTPKEKALSRAIQVLLDEHLYWVLVYSRWSDDHGWNIAKTLFSVVYPNYYATLFLEWRAAKHNDNSTIKASGGIHAKKFMRLAVKM